MRPELWFFEDNDGIHVLDLKFLFVEQLSCVLQENQTVRAFPFRIRVRKMSTNIADPRCAKKRVAQCVCQDVAVGMPNRSFIERNINPADDQLAPFRETV